jgi:hypothetical protein
LVVVVSWPVGSKGLVVVVLSSTAGSSVTAGLGEAGMAALGAAGLMVGTVPPGC